MSLKGSHIGRKLRPPSEEKVSRGISWSETLDSRVKAMAHKRDMAVTELVREYVEEGLARDTKEGTPEEQGRQDAAETLKLVQVLELRGGEITRLRKELERLKSEARPRRVRKA